MDISTSLAIRGVESGDHTQWRSLWKAYCDFYEENLADEVSDHIWSRFLQTDSPMRALVAVRGENELVGFAHYVLQENTWSLKPLCYLEDLFVKPEARGLDIGHGLISRLVEMGTQNEWRKVYWHTHETNARARRLYERFGPSDGFVRYNVSI